MGLSIPLPREGNLSQSKTSELYGFVDLFTPVSPPCPSYLSDRSTGRVAATQVHLPLSTSVPYVLGRKERKKERINKYK